MKADPLKVSLADVIASLGVLTENESKVYVKLLEEGASDARTLSLKTGIPRTQIYGELDKLQDRGLVASIDGLKRKFIPKDPSEMLGGVSTSLRARADVIDGLLQILRKKFEEGNIG